MGSWNETCGVSHLPIKEGDEIVIIPLTAWIFNNEVPNPRVTEIDKHYTPLCLPINGKYNDYGGVENIEDYKLVAAHLNRFDIRKNEVGRSYSAQLEDSNKEEFESDFNCLIARHKDYSLPKVTQGDRIIDFMIVRRDVFEFLVNKMAERVPLCRDVEKNDKTLRVLIEKVLDNEITQIYRKAAEEDDYALVEGKTDNVLRRVWGRRALEETFGQYLNLSEFIGEYCEGEYPDFKVKFTELVLFGYALEHLRKGWLCQTSGAGSSDNELQLHKDLAEFVLKIISDKQKAWREENVSELSLEETIYFR